MKEFIHNPALGIIPFGFIDDDLTKKGKSLNWYPILADLNHLEELLEGNSISEIVVSTGNISKDKLERLTNLCNSKKINLRRFEVTLEDLSPTPSATNG